MTQQNLNVGTNPNDGTGDPVRNAMIKVQNNFSDLYTNYVSAGSLASNLASYQTTAGLSANVITLTSNSTNFVGSVSAANVVSNAQLAANLTGYVSAFQFTSNLANYQTTAGLSANVAKLSANNASYLGTAPASAYVNTSSDFSLGGNITFTSNLIIAGGAALYANGSLGSGGQYLTSNGSSVYWSTFPGVNVAAQYTWSNTQTFNGNVTIGSSASLSANGSIGTNGQILMSNGSTVFWSSVANNTNFVGSVSAANVVSNAQLAANLTAYTTLFQLSSNLVNYQTTAGFTANVAAYLPLYTGTVNAAIVTTANATVTGNASVSGTISSGYIQVNNQTANYALVSSDSGKVIAMANSGSTVYINVNSGLPTGFRVMVTKMGAANIVFANGSGLSLGSRTGAYQLSNTYASASLFMANSTFAVIDGAI